MENALAYASTVITMRKNSLVFSNRLHQMIVHHPFPLAVKRLFRSQNRTRSFFWLTDRRLVFAGVLAGAWAITCGITHASTGAGKLRVGNGLSNIIWNMPALPKSGKRTLFDAALIPVWQQVLSFKDAEMQQVACRGISRLAQDGMPGLDVLEPQLKELATSSPFFAVRIAAIQTMVQLAIPRSAAFLIKTDAHGHDSLTILAIDPLLARWHSVAMFARWKSRATNSHLPTVIRISALKSMAQSEDSAGAKAVRSLVVNRQNSFLLRMSAARTLGKLHPEISGALAAKLLNLTSVNGAKRDGTKQSLKNGLLALALSRPAHDVAQRSVLVFLASGKRGILVQGAMTALLANHANLLFAQSVGAAKNASPEIRLLAAHILSKKTDVVSIAILARLTNDRRRFIRWYCRHELIVMGKHAALRKTVLTTCRAQLAHGGIRGRRQAAMVLGALHDLSSEKELLAAGMHGPRQVRVGAVLALRELAIANSVPTLFAYARRLAIQSIKKKEIGGNNIFQVHVFRDDNIQLAQIFQLIGLLRWRPAAAYLRTFVPKTEHFSGMVRASAIWALGRIYHRRRHPHFLALLAARLNDINPFDPESSNVRALSAIVTGELGTKVNARTVLSYYGPNTTDKVGMSCRWAYTKLTGKVLPIPVRIEAPRTGYVAAYQATR